MLQSLSIRDFVIVKSLDLDFTSGLTVLTGETGAGKSILIDALSLALGARGEGGVTRQGCEKAEISASFNIAQNVDALNWLQAAEIEVDANELLLRRIVFADGRSRAFINGATVTMTQLKELGEFLVDIYSQNAHHSLLKPATQRDVLDQFSGHLPLVQQVAQLYKEWHRLHLQRLEAEKNAHGLAEELADLRNLVSELNQHAVSTEEWEALQQSHVKLANSAGLLTGSEACQALLSEGDFSALRLLSQVQHKLNDLREYDEELQEVAELLDSAVISVEETHRMLNRYCQRLEIDPASLLALEAQMAEIHQLARKFRVQPEGLAALLAESKARVAALELMSDDGKLQQQEAAALAAYTQSANQLSVQRQASAEKLGQAITKEMQRLSLSGGQFTVALNPVAPSQFGLEQVEFLVAGHAGVAPKSLAKTASGGELSRISLAIRVVTAQKESIPTMIFDEVDVGIGGGVAEVVGQLLKQLAQSTITSKENNQRQVLVITHLPQVAAQGEQHLRVSKSQVDAQTLSTIHCLSEAERVEEIARMLGGLEITETTRQHAKEMLAG
jgi:DNA repair protein RecN (Recombination protein N)